jgi:purine-binding chemotaxis protein CheW
MRETTGSTDVNGGEGSSDTAIHSQQQRMEAVWRARAERLSQRPGAAAAGQDVLPVIVLRLGKECYGVELSDVTEVLPPVHATLVPGAPAVFAGVINVHGEIRPVIDLRRLLGLEAAPSGDLARVILLCKDSREMGLQIDSVEQIRWIGSAELRSVRHDDAARSQHITSQYIKGSTKDLLMLLSTEALFATLDTGVTT